MNYVTATTLVEEYEYGPYGEIEIFDQSTSTVSGSQIGNPFTYTGRRLDEESGLYYYRARHYSAELKRFMQRDPLEYVDGPNAYGYVAGHVLRGVDPLGLREVEGGRGGNLGRWFFRSDGGREFHGGSPLREEDGANAKAKACPARRGGKPCKAIADGDPEEGEFKADGSDPVQGNPVPTFFWNSKIGVAFAAYLTGELQGKIEAAITDSINIEGGIEAAAGPDVIEANIDITAAAKKVKDYAFTKALEGAVGAAVEAGVEMTNEVNFEGCLNTVSLTQSGTISTTQNLRCEYCKREMAPNVKTRDAEQTQYLFSWHLKMYPPSGDDVDANGFNTAPPVINGVVNLGTTTK